MYNNFKFIKSALWNRYSKASLLLIPAISVLAFSHNYVIAVDAESSQCSYRNVSPTSYTVVNHVQKCIDLQDGSDDIYTLTYKFKVTGISNAANK